ncbi:MAG: ATP-binding protein [Syntrophobacterales bacterium]|nr:ATP-binding protein [Syntrophobacterales bacterium]
MLQAAARYFSVQKGFDLLHCCVLDLIQEMVDAIKQGAYHAFRASVMRLDALFIDNIWLLRNRRQTAVELFALFEAFVGKGGLVMIASDLPASALSAWAPGAAPAKTLNLKT